MTDRRSQNAALRRSAIVNAALDEFAEKGFAAARMEDIARRAGVGKGTIYLHFADKGALFEAIVKQEIQPAVSAAIAAAASGGSLTDFVQHTLGPALREIALTRRGAVLRMMIGEAGRFPQLAEVYFRLVVEPGLEAIRTLALRGVERHELRDRAIAEFPQLLIAPLLVAVVWTGLFEPFRHLDVERMAHLYFESLTGTAVPEMSTS